MIEVDISNIWGEVALPELLAIEQEVAAAHAALSDGTGRFLVSAEEMERILKAAEALRACSEICVVVGGGGSCLGARAAIELLQGSDRNSGKGKGGPRLIFAGNSFSTRQWNALLGQLEGKDFSVIAVSCATLEAAVALRELKWLLERKYGTDESRRRVCAVTVPGEEALSQMADGYGWEHFSDSGDAFGVLSAGGLLPMAVAGIDIAALLRGAGEARERLELRSFENPAWLYAAVRTLLHRRGKAVEVLSTWEPDFAPFGSWWQRRFGAAGGAFPVWADQPGGLPVFDRRDIFETMLCFSPEEPGFVISSDANDLDGLNRLADRTFASVEEQVRQELLEAHADSGVPVITMDCGKLGEQTVGELFWLMALGSCLCAGMEGK